MPPELYDAAHADGANGWQRFRHVTLPLLTPIIAVVMTFSVLFTFTDFQLIYVLTRGGPLNATHLMATLAFQRGISGGALAVLARRLERPEPRVALGIALRGTASAMLDVSDGLTGDLGHILDASSVGARVDLDRIPCAPVLAARRHGPERELALACLLAGGDDYELLFTARNAARERVAAIGQEVGVPLTRIGTITPPGDGPCRARRKRRCAARAAACLRSLRGARMSPKGRPEGELPRSASARRVVQ